MTVTNKENIVPGKVSSLMKTGTNDVLIIEDEHGQTLVPSVSNYVKSVDIDNKTITADWGLGC